MSDDVARRATVHAALAEPTRLRLVDLLTLGDLAPGELGRLVGLGSNLLAHHLRVLDDAGVVQRVRSEGDGRRSYVRLVLDDPVVARLVPGVGAEPDPVARVVFVCTQNSARSHLAAAAFEQVSDVPVASAGTRPAARVNPVAAAVAARHDLDLSRRTTSHVDDVLREGDLVVSVCDAVHEELVPSPGRPALRGARPSPQVHWSVPDPVRVGTEQAFEAALTQITARVDRLGRAVTSSLENRS
ncbi:ArsR family transcriptional regulator [Aquipuribacter sp. MA13-6]|uniref:arsenate reductase/protein-tyrosine-phosphatase family protein n=1 Tax=unclassified Aquipuribacter TaxID=2635084 RepID=UPI003EEDC272